MDKPLVDIFMGALSEAQQARLLRPDLAAWLDEQVQRAAAAWPEVRLPAAAFVAHLAEVVARPENEHARLEDLHVEDLFLACACAAGDESALATCDAQASPEIDRALWKMDLPQATIDEATYQSLLRLVASRLDVSARLVFGDKRP
jgi:RNA polymerase sigma-70 factor, ECF subfamily